LHRIHNTNKKLFVAINKQDTVGPDERNEAINFVRERLDRFSFTDTAQIFSISARQGLKAKQAQNQEQMETSGLQALEAELLRFLTEERAQSFLVNTYERTRTFLIQRSRSQEHLEYEESYKQLIRQLRNLRGMILDMPNQPEKATATAEGKNANTYALQINRKTGCGICGAILEAILRFLREYQYVLTINPEIQQEHARRGGFCPLHTWQYETISSPYGVCVAYPELVHRLAAKLNGFASEIGDQGESMENLRSLLPTTKTCRICEVRIDAEKMAVQDSAEIVLHTTTSDASVPACCLSHLIMVADTLGSGEPAQKLFNSHANLLERTAEDLQRYALKHDALRRYLTSEEERQASQLALLLLAGHRNVSGPWVVEYI
jgi:hypothetical protein